MSVSKKSVMGTASVVLVVAGLLGTACSSSSTPAAPPTSDAAATQGGPPTCNSNPFVCPTGQTCVATGVSNTFACFNSGRSQVGASCRAMLDMATCGDGLVCLQSSPLAGVCAAYCEPTDPSHACSSGATCTAVPFNGGSTAVFFYVCVGAPVADAGASG